MKRKIDIDDLELVLNDKVSDAKKVDEILAAVREELKAEEQEKEKKERKKYDHYVLRVPTDSEEEDSEYLHFIVKAEQGEDFSRIPEAVRAAIREHNINAKTQKSKVSDIIHGIEKTAKKKFKENPILEINMVTKEPVIPIFCSNEITPTES